jgi:hypothetical protein
MKATEINALVAAVVEKFDGHGCHTNEDFLQLIRTFSACDDGSQSSSKNGW